MFFNPPSFLDFKGLRTFDTSVLVTSENVNSVSVWVQGSLKKA